MNLSDYIAAGDVHLDLRGNTKADVLAELAARLGLPDDDRTSIQRILARREEAGSTGIGRGIAVPHCRTPLVKRLRVGYGRRKGGVDWGALDGVPVEHIFVLIAPPIEASNEYLPVLGRVAKLAKEGDVPEKLAAAKSVADFQRLLAEKGV